MVHFEVSVVAAQLKAETKILRKPRTYAQRRSLLDKHTYELLQLYASGCSGSELQRWLAKKGLNVERSTISRWLHRKKQNG